MGLIEPYLPPPSRCGRPRGRSMREIVNGIFYVLRTGCPWRLIPSEQRWFVESAQRVISGLPI